MTVNIGKAKKCDLDSVGYVPLFPLNPTEKAYMQHWLYIKSSSVLFYYHLSSEKDPKVLAANCLQNLLAAETKIDFLFLTRRRKYSCSNCVPKVQMVLEKFIGRLRER